MKETFAIYNLDLTFREINTGQRNKELEFLDVLHCTDTQVLKGFKTKNFIKPTARNSVFLNGKSYHPMHVFRGIFISEAKRMRRLNECDEDYHASLIDLQNKCIRSGFDKNLVNKNLEIVKLWKRLEMTDTNTDNKIAKKDEHNKINWPTEFKNIIKLNKTQRKLAPEACITYCRPPTLGNHLLNYRKITQGNSSSENNTKPKACGCCGLCGHHGKLTNMVWEEQKFQNSDGKFFKSRHHLNCKDFGIYAGQCVICGEFYVGQTKNTFATRWNSHRSMWNRLLRTGINPTEKLKDDQALFHHYATHHKTKLEKQLNLANAFRVIFLERPFLDNLDIAENFWISKLHAKINIMKTFLPTYKSN